MTVVQIEAGYPSGAARRHRVVTVALVDGGAGGAAAGRVIADTERVTLDGDGTAEVDLVPSSQIDPPGTFYRLTVEGAQPSVVRHITVPDVGPVSWADPGIQVLSPAPPEFTPIKGDPGDPGPTGVVDAVGELVHYDPDTRTLTVSTPTAEQVGADGRGAAEAAVSRAGLPGSAGLVTPGLDAWWTALAGARTAPVDVVMIGDSLNIGSVSSPPWPWLLGDALAAVSAGAPVQQWVTALGSGHPRMTSCQGVPNTSTIGGGGADLAGGQTATQVGWCDAVSVVWSGGSGVLTVRDGGPSGTVLGTIDTSTGTGAGNVWTSGSISPAHREIHISSTGATTFSGVFMHSGNRAAGVRVWGAARSGWGSADFTSDPTRALDLIESLDPALVIIEVATNDPSIPTELDALVDAVEALSPGTIVGVVPPTSPAISEAEVADVRSFYDARSIPVIDIDRGIPDYQSALVSDGVHPTPEGRAAFAAVSAAVLTGNPIVHASRHRIDRVSGVSVGGILESEMRLLGSLEAHRRGHDLAPRIEIRDVALTAPDPTHLHIDGDVTIDTPGSGWVAIRNYLNQPIISITAEAGDPAPIMDIGARFGFPVMHMSNRAGDASVELIAGVQHGEAQLDVDGLGVLLGGTRRQVQAVTTTAYTTTAEDRARLVTRDNGAASTHTWPSDATVPIPVGTEIPVANVGAGTITHSAGPGASIITGSTTTQAQGQRLVATKTAADTWLLT